MRPYISQTTQQSARSYTMVEDFLNSFHALVESGGRVVGIVLV